jgi:hypothetical protein
MDASANNHNHTASEFECASLDAVLSRGVSMQKPVQVKILPHQLNHFFHHHSQEPPQQHDAAAACDSHTTATITSHHDPSAASGDEQQDVDTEEDYEKRLIRCRERNKEHARRTRLRKKAQLELLRVRVKALETEKQRLRQQIEECSIASILIGLPGETNDILEDEDTKQLLASNESNSNKFVLLTKGKRKRYVPDGAAFENDLFQPILAVEIDGETKYVGTGKAHINWKTGVYSDETGAHSQLSTEQLETLRYVSCLVVSARGHWIAFQN